ncbi:two-component system sensor histidine kinase YesM [Bacillus tianshenii]|uniref:histidine kinase n=1 Tax=Sutcliffiella tianshenii TaxID=1463404 RepID=A0ABS2NUU7_9BACI|nr:sensor histidine kinase [Bacillus tianshenii]MBM7618434.1 two-component system sensor histidine kinase YesM [Bacillus tianshenii]
MIRKSIRNKLIVLLLLITILPFGTSIIITYYHTKEAFKDLVVQENSNLLYQGKINLETYLEELNSLTLSLYNNPDFINYMRSPDKEDNYMTLGIVKNVLQTILYAEDNIRRVHISFAEEKRSITASKRSTVVFSTRLNSRMYEEAYKNAQLNPYNMFIDTTEAQQGRNVLYLHRVLRNVPSDEVLAFITIEVSTERVLELSENLYNKETEEFFILSSTGELIYSSNAEVFAKQAEQKWIGAVMESDKERGTMEWQNDSFHGMMMYEQTPAAVGGWILVKRVPYTTLYENAFTVTKINILFGVLGLSLVILATLFVSFKITSPIRVLLQNIQQVKEGNMKVQFESLGHDEIGILGSRFKQMMERIDHLINREYKLEIENKNNQLKVLQSQLNPHFLYNALQSIGTVALKNNVPQIYTLVTHLSKIMRYGMNMEEDMVPLKKEINYLKAYLLLQKERFGDHLDYRIDVGEDALQVQVPKMILQPIIENYFKHGFDIREGVGRITVEGKVEEGMLILEVVDNGVGVTEERLEEIYRHFQAGKRESREEVTNIGLKNINARLQLYYDGAASMKLSNHHDGGLAVKLVLPLELGGVRDEGDHH